MRYSTKNIIQSWKAAIKLNPFTLVGELLPLKNNGYGTLVEDINGVPVPKSYTNKVRVSTTKGPIKKIEDMQTPYVYENKYYMISDNVTIVDVGLRFTYEGVPLKVLQRESKKHNNTIIGYEYQLEEIGG